MILILPGTLSQNPPDVTIVQTAFGAQVSTTITLGCTVTSDTTVTSIFWQRDIGSGTVTITVDGINFSGSTPTVPSLTIINSDTTDSGTYQCFATNAAGTSSSATATVTIVSAVPTVTVAQSAYSTTTGTSVTLTCTVSSATTVTTVFWQRTIGGNTITLTIDNVNYSGSSPSTPSLTVIAADSGDVGSYTCFAVNSAGTGNSAATTLSVTGTAPTVTVGSTFYSTTTGTTFTLRCTVTSSLTITHVFWQRTINGVTSTLTIDNVNYSGASTSSPSLTIISADSGDTGTYTCFGANAAGTTSATTQLTVTGSAPTVTVGSTSYSTTTGTTFTLQCTVTSSLTITYVFWQRTINGVTSTLTIDNVNYSGASTSSPSLTIISADPTDTGTYTCFGANAAGTSSATTQLTVTGSIPVVTVGQASYSATTGTSISLVCTVSADPTHTTVFWRRDVGSGTESLTIDNVNYSGSQVNTPSLTVISTEIADSGTYTCFATNAVGTGQSSTTLTVSGTVPTTAVTQSFYTATTGTSITLWCTVINANPAHTNVFWQCNVGSGTQSITIDNINYSGSQVGTPSLTIINVNPTDSGIYSCFATNVVGTSAGSTTTLTVTGNEPSVVVSQPSYSVLTGSTVTLNCTVSANPSHTSVQWLKVVNISGKYTGSSVSSPSLTISGVQPSDQGQYICTASNVIGTGQSSVTTLSVTNSKYLYNTCRLFNE
ncbi:mucin-22-like isoform X3 [Argopecten irradians]|uniref:mucin-22-like isoform X3 n=1 Tax=Argopecten irradians TaxID=31199 RepID=UPI003712BCB2